MSDDAYKPDAMTTRGSTHADVTAAFAGAIVVLLGTMLAVGGIHPRVSAVFGAGAAVVLLISTARTRTPPPLVAIVFFCLGAVTLLQCVPMPTSLLRLVAPANADVWARALTPLGQPGPSWAPISLAPELTLVEATKWAGYGAIAFAAHAWTRVRGLTGPASAALGLALVAGAATLAHGLVDAKTVFGVYTPAMPFPRWRMGPFLNSNHLTGYLMLGVYGGLALLVSKRTALTWKTALILAGTAALVFGIVLLKSRAGVALLGVGVIALPAVFVSAGKKKEAFAAPKSALMLGLSVFVMGGSLAAFGYGHQVLSTLAGKEFGKLKLLRDVPAILHDHWFAGFGRGAFESAYFAYRSIPHHEYWTHPENFLVQWSTEWGVPVTLAAIAGFVAVIVRSGGLRASIGARTLLLGLFIVLAQNLFDFGLELPAVGGLAALLLGSVSGLPGEPSRRRGRVASPFGVRRGTVAGAVLGTLLAALSLAAFQRGPRLLSDLRRQAFVLSQTLSPTTPGVYAPFAAWMLRYPAEPWIPLYGGLVAGRFRPLDSMPWLNRALELGPRVAATHLTLAQELARAHLRSQALLEIRLTAEYDEDWIDYATALALGITNDPDEIMASVPLDAVRAEIYLDKLIKATPMSPLHVRLREQILGRSPCNLRLRDEAIGEILVAMGTHAPPCDAPASMSACDAQAGAEIQKLRACPGGYVIADRQEAELAWVRGDANASIQLLEGFCSKAAAGLTACLKTLAERAAAAKDLERVRKNIRLVTSRSCQGVDGCSATWAWASATFTKAGDFPSAYMAAVKASEFDPSNVELRRQLAEAAMRAGARDRAESALDQLLLHRPDDAAARARLAEIRAMPMVPAPGALPVSSSGRSSLDGLPGSRRSGKKDNGPR